MTPKKSVGRGAFDQRKGPHGGKFDQKINKKCQMPGGHSGGGMGTLGFDSYISVLVKKAMINIVLVMMLLRLMMLMLLMTTRYETSRTVRHV